MLACGHEKTQFGVPLCSHMRTCRQPWLQYVKWYTGSGLKTEFICAVCAEARAKGLAIDVEYVCEECFEYATREVGDLTKSGGQPEILVFPEQFDAALISSKIPTELGEWAARSFRCEQRQGAGCWGYRFSGGSSRHAIPWTYTSATPLRLTER
jgi:hypothetical protein